MDSEKHTHLKQHLKIMTYFSKSMFRNNTVDDVLWDVVSNCIKELKFVDCIIYLIDKQRNVLVQKAAYGDKNIDYKDILNPIELNLGQGIVGTVAQTGIAEIISNTSKDSRYFVDDLTRLSEIAVPIFYEGKVIGVIDSEHPEACFYNDFHLDVLKDIAAISGIKIATLVSKNERDDLALLLLENPNPVFQVSSSLEVILSNEAAQKIIKKISKLDEQQRYEKLYRHVKSALKTKQPTHPDLYLDGQVYSMDIVPYETHNYVNLYLENITDYMQAKDDAERATQAKTEFISDMSHEIRTPLNGILNLNRLLKLSEKNPKRLEMFEAVEYSGENLLSIINNILEYEKLGAGKVVFQKDVFEVREILNKLHRLMLPKAHDKSLNLNFNVDKSVPTTLVGDEIRLLQILSNLILNALKFTDEGSVSLNINVESQKSAEVKLKISISDTGIGIPKDEIDFIFNKYVQVYSRDRRFNEGTGLGLSITQRLVEQQGGTITIESEIGEGTCFTLFLPYSSVRATSLKASDSINASEIDLTGYKVLIVDDSPINVFTTEQFLLHWSVEVLVAESGFEAIKICRTKAVDLILMDLQMPGIDGFETTRAIRRSNGLNSQTPIIAMSADVLTHSMDDILKAGLNDSSTKPFNPDELKLMIYRHIKGDIRLNN